MKPSPVIKTALFAGIVVLLVGVAAAFFLYRQGASEGAATAGGPAPVDLAETRRKAEAGDAAAQCLLGEICQQGRQTKADYAEAARWFRLAAEKGFARAQYNLGQLHDVGRGVPHDEAEAARWYLQAAENGHTEAQYIYASMCSLGRGVAINVEAALKWYRRAAEQGDGLSMFQLAERYERARGVTEDLGEAYFWHLLAADRGVADSASILTRLDAQVPAEKRTAARQRMKEFKNLHGKNWPAL